MILLLKGSSDHQIRKAKSWRKLEMSKFSWPIAWFLRLRKKTVSSSSIAAPFSFLWSYPGNEITRWRGPGKVKGHISPNPYQRTSLATSTLPWINWAVAWVATVECGDFVHICLNILSVNSEINFSLLGNSHKYWTAVAHVTFIIPFWLQI